MKDFDDDIFDEDEEELEELEDSGTNGSDGGSIVDIISEIKKHREKDSDDESKDKDPSTSKKADTEKDSNKTTTQGKASDKSGESVDLDKKNIEKVKNNNNANNSAPSKMDALSSGGKTLGSGLNTLSSAQRTKEAAEEGNYGKAIKSGIDTAKNAKNTVDNAKKTADTWKQMKSASDTAKAGSVATTTSAAGAAGSSAAAGAAATSTATSTAVTTTSTSLAGAGAGASAGAGAGGLAALGPGLIVVAIIVAVIILIMVITSIALSVATAIAEKTDPDNMVNNSYIDPYYFYGLRVAYVDDVELSNSLQLSYKQYVIDVLNDILEDGANEISLTISLPEQNFDNETEISQDIINMALAIANIAATENDSTEYLSIDFETLYPNIHYFGLTQTERDVATNFIVQYLTDNSLIKNASGDQFNGSIDKSLINDDADLQYILNRCEKVMIKDHIATEDGVNDIEKRLYLGSIYMPCKNITITSSTIAVVNENPDLAITTKLISRNNNSEEIINERAVVIDDPIVTGLKTKQNFNTFTSIDAENSSVFAGELSLFDAIKISQDYAQFFTVNEETNLYTWKPTDENMVYLQFEWEQGMTEFIYTDFSLTVTPQ